MPAGVDFGLVADVSPLEPPMPGALDAAVEALAPPPPAERGAPTPAKKRGRKPAAKKAPAEPKKRWWGKKGKEGAAAEQIDLELAGVQRHRWSRGWAVGRGHFIGFITAELRR